MTRYIAAYDTERPSRAESNVAGCLEACAEIVKLHHKYRLPATFFVVGKILLERPDEFRRLLDDPLFEVASHTWSHRMLRDQPFCGKAVDPAGIREEVLRGKEAVDQVFADRNCLGLRPGCSFVDGLSGAPDVLREVSDAGYEYVSSKAWGPDYTLPAPLNQAYSYADDGFSHLMEYPCHGWHDNVLKACSGPGYWTEPRRLVAFPPPVPEAIPPAPLAGPEDEFRYNSRPFIDRAVKGKVGFVSLVWHPWSLLHFDPELKMLDMTFRHALDQGLQPTTYGDMHRQTTGAAPCP